MWKSLKMEEGSSQIPGEEIITGQNPEPPLREASPVRGNHVIRTAVGPVFTDAKEANETRKHCIYTPSDPHTCKDRPTPLVHKL